MKSTLQTIVFSTGLTLGVVALSAPAQALTNYTFEVVPNSGLLTGDRYSGSFEFEESQIDPTPFGEESAPLTTFSFTFEGVDYALNDQTSASPASAFFSAGDFLGIDYNFDDSSTAFSFVPGFFAADESFFSYDVDNSGGFGDISYSTGATSVPEPTFLSGLVGIGIVTLRKKRRVS